MTHLTNCPIFRAMNTHANPQAEIARGSLLHVMPMRITTLQFTRLDAARDRDGLAIQEHIRRAIDYYLGALERQAGLEDHNWKLKRPLSTTIRAENKAIDAAAEAAKENVVRAVAAKIPAAKRARNVAAPRRVRKR